MKKILMILGLIIIFSSLCYADYSYTPFNFELQTNHTFNISLDGNIEVILPINFTLVSGNLTGINLTNFLIESPLLIRDESLLFNGTINVNGTFYEGFYLLYTPTEKIVDTKIEIGHGDFNYIDPDSYIGTDNTLLFNLVRIWTIGVDIIGEPATDIRFNCTYPKIIPNTVDSKYTTTYNSDDITATGNLLRMKGFSLFRLFVLSQEVNQDNGTNYEVTCDTLYYNIGKTEVIADIQDINLSVRTTEPLQISMINNSEYITYTILNSEDYDLRELEFLFEIGTDTIRKELSSLDSGESYSFNLDVNLSGTVDLKARFIPEWMFNSRSPVYYEQTTFETYYTPSVLASLNTSLYYENQTINNPNVLTGQELEFGINILQSPPFGGDYVITYNFFDSGGTLSYSIDETITGTGNKLVDFLSSPISVNGKNNLFTVKTIVTIKDSEGNDYSFDTEQIGTQIISAHSYGGQTIEEPILAGADTELLTEVTGLSLIEDTINKSDINPFFYIIGLILLLCIFIIFVVTRRKRKKDKQYK